MSAGTQISQFEKAQDIPRGTTFVAEMGDGSGTKGITQEVLTKKVGEGLKIGNTEELQTKNKDNLVAAINEVAQMGGGGTSVDIDILDSREEIEANTESEKVAGALAVKEMFSGLKGFEPVLDDAGQMVGYKTQVGADTVFPFTKNILTNISPTQISNSITIKSKVGEYYALSYFVLTNSSKGYPNPSVTGGGIVSGGGILTTHTYSTYKMGIGIYIIKATSTSMSITVQNGYPSYILKIA